MFSERQDNTVIHVSHMGKYMLRAQKSETLQTFTFPLLLGKQNPSAIFQADGKSPIPSHVFPFLFIVQEDIALIHDAAFFFHVCAFASVVDPFLRNIAHMSLRYISTIHSVPLSCYTIHIISIRLRRSPSRATPGNPASPLYFLNIGRVYPTVKSVVVTFPLDKMFNTVRITCAHYFIYLKLSF
jgi:hypothetical protein